MEQWRQKQEKELRKMAEALNEDVIKQTGYPLASGWLRWATDYLCTRFKYVEKPRKWVDVLASMSDDVLSVKNYSTRELRYLKMLRDYARRYVK